MFKRGRKAYEEKLLAILMATCMLSACGSQSNAESAKKIDTQQATRTAQETETQQTEVAFETEQSQESVVGNVAGVAN